jgi:hypothetical protein
MIWLLGYIDVLLNNNSIIKYRTLRNFPSLFTSHIISSPVLLIFLIFSFLFILLFFFSSFLLLFFFSSFLLFVCVVVVLLYININLLACSQFLFYNIGKRKWKKTKPIPVFQVAKGQYGHKLSFFPN